MTRVTLALGASAALLASTIALGQASIVTGPSSSADPYVRPIGGKVTDIHSILTVGDDIGGYLFVGIPDGMGGFMAGKGAMDVLTIGLGREVAAEGIRVNAVRPGIIDTEIHDSSGIPGRVKLMRDQIPMKREGKAEEVADVIVWLCSDQSSYVTGSIVPVAGGRC